jgi:hypothetical protein
MKGIVYNCISIFLKHVFSMENTRHIPKRTQSEYKQLSRVVFINHYKTEVSKKKRKKEALKKIRIATAQPEPVYNIADLLNEDVVIWLKHVFKHLFTTKAKFRSYPSHEQDQGVYPLHCAKVGSEKITFTLTADWATDTKESLQIANRMMSHQPDYTIHLGDTYYVAEMAEIADNFLVEDAPWPKGPCGSFSLMGNHEMYTQGTNYYNYLLPALGVYDRTTRKYAGQKASFFALQNQHWIILALDTGYNSIGFPFIWNSFRADCRFEPEQMEWLRANFDFKNDTRGILIITHQQYCSAFEETYNKPGEQLAELIGESREVLWIWGHEHRFSLYGKYKGPNGVTAYGRCIGNGGAPIELEPKKATFSAQAAANKLVCTDEREREQVEEGKNEFALGWNGYTLLELEKEILTLSYHDVNKKLLEEKWTIDLGTAKLKGMSVTRMEMDPGFLFFENKTPQDLIAS